MTELVTVHVDQGRVRVSRITPHGEEIIDPNTLVTALAVTLWERVAAGPLEGYVDRSPDFVAQALALAVGDIAAPLLEAHLEDRRAVQQLRDRLDALNEAVAQMRQIGTPQPPPPVVNPRGV